MPNRPTLPTAHPTAPLKPACQPLPAHLPLPLRAAPPQNLPARRQIGRWDIKRDQHVLS